MTTAWRIVKQKHAAAAFDGEGARLFGGRWTSPGQRVIYTSGSVALAALEIVVHVDRMALLAAYVVIEVSIPDQLIEAVDVAALPGDWRTYPAPAALQRLGDAWLADQRSAVLRVPTAITGIESNYLINPAHPDYGRITIGEQRTFTFDPRLG